MAIDYDNLRDGAVKKALDDFGFPMVLVSSREPTIDPDTGEVSAEPTEVRTTVTGLFRFYSQDEMFKALQAGQDILQNDIQALIEASTLDAAGIEPDTAMQLVAKGETYNVVRNTPTWPGGTALLYRLQIRK